jgi:hypothetical protein
MSAHETLLTWENFYIIVGSSAGALTGLQFVVMALIADSGARTGTSEVDAFGTPTIVHFCAVLLVSAVLSAPWPQLWQAAAAVGAIGAAGIVYTLIVMRRARRTQNYKPETEDWIWHAVLPLVAYVTLSIGAGALPVREVPALFAIGVYSLLLIFTGIHNAWDSVIYVSVVLPRTPPKTD